MPPTPLFPAAAHVAGIARSLKELSGDVVFIGGAIAPLLQINPPMPRVRATEDVDAIIGVSGYLDYERIEARLRVLGFRRARADADHAYRLRTPQGTPFDLVPSGQHLRGSRSEWDRRAVETAVEAELEPGVMIRHASAIAFLGLKWAAFFDRGKDDPFESEDLEDIIAILVSRDNVVGELAAAPLILQQMVRRGCKWLAEHPDYPDLAATHLGSARPFGQVSRMLRERVEQVQADYER